MTLPGTPASSVTNFIPTGNRHYWFVSTIAAQATPTYDEIDAGTLLDGVIASVSGWTKKADMVDVPNAADKFVASIPGTIKADDSAITVYMDSGGSDLRSTFSQGTSGYVLFADGDAPAKLDVYPVTVTSASKSSALTDAATLEVSFAITAEPSIDVTFPSAT
ncbi:MAG TPA: hypothetical protein VFJ14_17935 [Nocardioidaceae bacterium]|nr:hypothetical protein [Nocardioidaceae bacterium]